MPLIKSSRIVGMRILALAMACLFAACTDSDSDNFKWVIVSNPSGGEVKHGGLVFTWRHSSKSFSVIGGATNAGRAVVLRVAERGGRFGADPNETREIYLAADSDAVVVVRRDGGEIYSPALSAGLQTVSGAMGVRHAPDSATALRVETFTEIIHIAAAGNLLLVETPSGIFARRPGEAAKVFPVGSAIDALGDDYLIREPGGRRTLIKPPPPTPVGSQAVHDGRRGSYRFYSYANEFSAELSAARFKVMDGSSGIALDGSFPTGAGGALDTAFRAVLPARNHNLLMIRTPR
jgi:hypothetical protein